MINKSCSANAQARIAFENPLFKEHFSRLLFTLSATSSIDLKVCDRIVCIDRHYVHSIVRGKEAKSVEFDAKANIIQIDNISFKTFTEV